MMSCSRNDKNNAQNEHSDKRAAADKSQLQAGLRGWWHRRGCAVCREVWDADTWIETGLAQMRGNALSEDRMSRMLAALGLPTLPAPTPESRARLRTQLRHLLLLIGVILFAVTLAQPELIGRAVVEKRWFSAAQPNALQSAGLWLTLGLFLYIKPLFALWAQRAGSLDRLIRLCLPASALLAAVLWLLLSATASPLIVTALVLAIGALLALAGTLMGGVLVAQGQRLGATGRMGALHAGAIFLARLAGAGVVEAASAGGRIAVSCIAAGLLIAFALLSGALLRHRNALPLTTAPEAVSHLENKPSTFNLRTPFAGLQGNAVQVGSNALEREQDVAAGLLPRIGAMAALRGLLGSRNVLATVGIAFLVYAAPNFTALQVQENVRLGLGQAAQDSLDFTGGACGLIGVGVYLFLCRRLPLQTLLHVGIVCNGLGTLLYLGYRSLPAALCIEAANGLLSALLFAMLFDLAIRAIPRGQAMLGYAFLTGVFALSSHLSNVFGSWLQVQAGWHFAQIVGLSAALSLPALAVALLLPAALLDRREGKIVQEAALGGKIPPFVPSYGQSA